MNLAGQRRLLYVPHTLFIEAPNNIPWKSGDEIIIWFAPLIITSANRTVGTDLMRITGWLVRWWSTGCVSMFWTKLYRHRQSSQQAEIQGKFQRIPGRSLARRTLLPAVDHVNLSYYWNATLIWSHGWYRFPPTGRKQSVGGQTRTGMMDDDWEKETVRIDTVA